MKALLLLFLIAITGSEDLTVFRVKMNGIEPECSVEEIRGYLQTNPQNMNALYSEASHGQFSFDRIVIKDVGINVSLDSCSPAAWLAEVDSQTSFDTKYRMYVSPADPTVDLCGSIGYGFLGGTITWILDCRFNDIYAHEIGHNLGMHHARRGNLEYGDTSDPMGYANIGFRHFNAPHKEQMGWTEPIVAVIGGVFELAPLETGARQIKFKKPGTNLYYHISHRAVHGAQSTDLPEEYQNKTSIHTAGKLFEPTQLKAVLDNEEVFTEGDLSVQQLEPGVVFIDKGTTCFHEDVYHPNGQSWKAHWCSARHFLCLVYGVCVPKPRECDE